MFRRGNYTGENFTKHFKSTKIGQKNYASGNYRIFQKSIRKSVHGDRKNYALGKPRIFQNLVRKSVRVSGILRKFYEIFQNGEIWAKT